MFFKKRGENPESDPKVEKRNKWLLRIGIGAAVFVACFTVLDKGTALRLMMNPNVEKIIWVPCWEFGADSGKGIVTSACYGLGEAIFGNRAYGKDGKKLYSGRSYPRFCIDTDMFGVFNEKEQTVTFYSSDGKERETIHLDEGDITYIDYIYFESGIMCVGTRNQGSKWLNFRTNQVYDNIIGRSWELISDGFIGVRQNGLYGYLDINGNERIAPQYDGAGLFKNGLAKVRKADGSCVLVDKNGTETYIEGLTSNMDDYDGQLIEVRDGFVNREGKYIVRREDYDDYVSIDLLTHSRMLVEGDEFICVLDVNGTEMYRSGKTLDSGYTYDGFKENSNGTVLLRYYMDSDNPDKYTILSQSGELIAEYVDEEKLKQESGCVLYTDENEWIAVLEDGRLVPTGIEADLNVETYGANPLVLISMGSALIISESGEKYVFEGVGDSLQRYGCYEDEEGEIFVTGSDGSSGFYSTKKGEILPAEYESVDIASPKLLAVENTLLEAVWGHAGWGYVVVLK